MWKITKTVEQFEFKNGDEFILDDIRGMQDIANGDWWSFIYDDCEDIVITRDIKITLIIQQ